MAGDWIKMRGALLDHPKVIAISRALHRNKDFREWLAPGYDTPEQIVGDAALRCVTTALLMRVWSIAREHGRFVENDLILQHSQIADIDQMAGAPGVGEAMLSVHWVVQENGVTLPNFREFNVPMTPAEKQREYRKRNALSNDPVTPSLLNDGNEKGQNVTTREEKRREVQESTAQFAIFWQAYPRKVAKQDALKAWTKLKLENGDFQRVMEALETVKQTEQWRRNSGEFVPYPATWLNGRRFDDELDPAPLKKVSL